MATLEDISGIQLIIASELLHIRLVRGECIIRFGFTPLSFSVDGLVGMEAKDFLDLLADKLAFKMGQAI